MLALYRRLMVGKTILVLLCTMITMVVCGCGGGRSYWPDAYRMEAAGGGFTTDVITNRFGRENFMPLPVGVVKKNSITIMSSVQPFRAALVVCMAVVNNTNGAVVLAKKAISLTSSVGGQEVDHEIIYADTVYRACGINAREVFVAGWASGSGVDPMPLTHYELPPGGAAFFVIGASIPYWSGPEKLLLTVTLDRGFDRGPLTLSLPFRYPSFWENLSGFEPVISRVPSAPSMDQ
jgi:hypothetical protein